MTHEFENYLNTLPTIYIGDLPPSVDVDRVREIVDSGGEFIFQRQKRVVLEHGGKTVGRFVGTRPTRKPAQDRLESDSSQFG